MRQTRINIILGLALLLLFSSREICLGFNGKANIRSSDQAMRIFINAMASRDKNTVLSFFSEKVPCKKVFYMIGTTKPMYTGYIYYSKLAADFRNNTGYYNTFFQKPNGYTYLSNFKRNVMWKNKGNNTFVHPHSDFGTTYIKWRLIDGKWKIIELGDSGP